MAAARIKAAHSNYFRYVYVFFALIYITSETCNVNVNRFATKGMKIDYVSVNLFKVYGMPIYRHVVRRIYPSNVRYCNNRIAYYLNGIAAFNLAKSTILISMDMESNPGPNSEIELDCRRTNHRVHSPGTSKYNNLHCGLINCRSICNMFDDFQAVVYGKNLDIVGVTEMWLNADFYDNKILSDKRYNIYRRDRGGNRLCGGVMLVVKTDLLSYRRSDFEPANSEILVCDVYPFNQKKYTICICYCPPDCQQFFYAFGQLLSKLESTTRVCIIGDFNMPSINWTTVVDSSTILSV